MIVYTAFLMGLMGSLHCVGMCGPIALAIPIPRNTSRWQAILAYNIGRVVTYGSIGALVGTVGHAINLAGHQQTLSIVSGIAIILMALFPFLGIRWHVHLPWTNSLKKRFSDTLQKRKLASLFALGLLNGLLPCGLVYIALVGAVSTGHAFQSMAYMALFGAGTVPAMAMVSYSKNLWGNRLRKNMLRIVPAFACLVGLLLIIRGFNLGIPYLSPQLQKGQVSCHPTKTCH